MSNIFKTTNVTNLTKIIQKNFYRVLQVTSKWKTLFKGSWVLTYFWHSSWHYFGYISGKVAKPHFLESPQKSLKPRQYSYQYGCPLRNKSLLKIWKICVFLAAPFSNKKIADICNFEWIKYLGRGWSYWKKMRYRTHLLLKLRVVEVATSFHWIPSRSTRATSRANTPI